MRLSSSPRADRAKLNARMLRPSGRSEYLMTPYRSAATVVLPEPGAAMMKTRCASVAAARFCSLVSVSAMSPISAARLGGRFPARTGEQEVEEVPDMVRDVDDLTAGSPSSERGGKLQCELALPPLVRISGECLVDRVGGDACDRDAHGVERRPDRVLVSLHQRRLQGRVADERLHGRVAAFNPGRRV